MKLHSYWRSSSAYRVRIVLEHKRLAYEYVAVDLSPSVAEQQSEAYAQVNAQRQVPTLELPGEHGLVRLSQSVAIAEYLEERYPERPLLPRDPLPRARVRQAVEIVNSGIQPLQNSGTIALLEQLSGVQAARKWCRGAIARGLGALEAGARTASGLFLVGDAPTLADVFLVPQLYNARRFGLELGAYPTLSAVEARASALDAFARAHPDVQPDAPREGARS